MHWMLMPLRRYADFEGRSRRKEYWMFVLLQMLVAAAVGLLVVLLYFTTTTESQMMIVLTPVCIVAGLFSLACLIPGIAVTVRRLHDIDRSGWAILFGLIPIAGAIVLLVFYCTEGTKGPNRFGPDPIAGETDGRVLA